MSNNSSNQEKTKRDELKLLVGLMLFFAFILMAVPFIGSLYPSEQAKHVARIKVLVSDIPDAGALAVDYQGYKALIVKKPEISVFLIPFRDGKYYMPDMSWDHAYYPCNNFILTVKKFSCEDDNWQGSMSWDNQGIGHNDGEWPPNLEKSNFEIHGSYLVLSPEFD